MRLSSSLSQAINQEEEHTAVVIDINKEGKNTSVDG